MTAKRFTISIDSNDRKSIWDDERTEEEPLIALNRFGEIWGIDDCCKLLNEQHETIKQLKQKITELELLNDGLNYALKYIKRIDVEIDIGDDTE